LTKEFVGAILCVLGVACGFLLFIFSLKSIVQMSRKSLWSKTTGTITGYDVDEKVDEDGNRNVVTHVQYKYGVDGISYRSKSRRIGLYYYVTMDEEKEIDDPVGKQLPVYYLRSKPKKSALSLPNYRFVDSVGLVLGLGFISVCGWVLRLILIEIFS
jgi:hypothetical protein